MSSIPQKWLLFATKYQTLPESQKGLWREKLTFEQNNYLDYILKTLNKEHLDQKQINQTPSKIIEIRKDSVIDSNLQQSQSRPASMNLAMSMPSRTLDYGRVKKNSIGATNIINTPVIGNMSKEDYEKSKIQNNLKNLASQVVLVVLALALPIGSVFFALNNSNLVRSTASTNVFTKANAENNPIDMSNAQKQYDTWVAQYNDLGSLEKAKDADPDNDGLTNLEESIFKTIPTNARTCNGPRLDGENILASINPVSCKPINFNDPAIAAQFDGVVSRTVINERLSLIALTKYKLQSLKSANTDETKNQKESIFDKTSTGELKIISSSLDSAGSIPVAWLKSMNQAELISKLEKQVVIYPTNSDPGQTGNIYLSGHGFVDDGSTTGLNLFTKLDKLNPGDVIELNLKLQDGNTKKYYYKVQKQNLLLASDPKQFAPNNDRSVELTLGAPWPDYSPEHRMIIKAVLDRVE